MDEEYDVIVLGTGLTECILSGLMSIEGKKVLHMDRNNYYGGTSASLSPLSTVFEKFGVTGNTEKYGKGRLWNVDLIPKFLMADGRLVSLLVHTGVTRYLHFQSVMGSFVLQKGKIHKVPSTEWEALTSGLVSAFGKKHLRDFFHWISNVDENNPSTWSSVYRPPDDPKKNTIEHALDHFGIDKTARHFIGHALCLYSDDSYKQDVCAMDAIKRIQLYHQSVARFGNSPYLYPLYGLGELPQAFARLSAVYGGTYMLDKPVDEIVFEDGKVVGVKSGEEVAKCSTVICDPSYATDKVKKVGQVARAICILNHPIPNTKNATSLQIIIPQNEVNRKNDIYVSCVSSTHQVCPNGFYIAMVATTVETTDPLKELKPGLDLLGPIEEQFFTVDDLYEPTDDGLQTRLFISKSYDASTHFESTCVNVLDLFQRITGKPFDFSKVKEKLVQNDGDE